MAAELTVDFPPKRNRYVVRFAETAQLYIVERHEDETKLWYTKAEYNLMKRNIKQDVLQACASDAATEEESGFWIGISHSHLLTPACKLEVQACTRRCLRAGAVLAEQARQEQEPSRTESLRCEDIALASLAATGKAVL